MHSPPTTRPTPTAHRILTSALALLVLVLTLPRTGRLVCMLKSGSAACCCIEPASSEVASCCAGSDTSRQDTSTAADPRPDASLPAGPQRDDGDSPCGCGDDQPEPPQANPEGGDDASATFAALPTDASVAAWQPRPVARAAVPHAVPALRTGPPLFVLYEVFLI